MQGLGIQVYSINNYIIPTLGRNSVNSIYFGLFWIPRDTLINNDYSLGSWAHGPFHHAQLGLLGGSGATSK